MARAAGGAHGFVYVTRSSDRVALPQSGQSLFTVFLYLRRQMRDEFEEFGNVIHHKLGQRREEARHGVGKRQALCRRLGGVDEPAADEAVVAEAGGDEGRVGELRLISEDALLE